MHTGNEMAAAAVFAKSSNRYNSTIYQPISMKFETRTQNDMPILAAYKPEVKTGNKMAAAAVLAKSLNRYNSTIYQPISTRFETRHKRICPP